MNKLIVVTGGTKGIGRAILSRFAGEGFNVITCARNAEDLQALKKEFEENYPDNNTHIFQADVSRKSDTLAFAKEINQLNQPVEILVNNAGVFLPGEVHAEEDGKLEMMIETNLYSAYYLTRALVPQMKAARSGHIFNMCSTASIMAYVNGGSYCISKFALLGMSKVLREELKQHNIRVTSILPGATFTASWEGVDLPPERFMKAEDVAEAVASAYRMSPQSVAEEILIRPQLGDL
jgi:short-subunit dehydrogenase